MIQQQLHPQKQNKQMKKPKGYLLMHNISKKNNIGNIIRSACAFNIQKMFYISNRPQNSTKMKTIMKDFHIFGNQGTSKQMQYHSFQNLKQAKQYFKANQITVCGIQICQNSLPIHKQPFKGDTVFLLGNEGSGIIPQHKQICDYFAYIPQYTNKTASLNVSVAAGIVFNHFALWAGYQEVEMFGEKFQYQQEPIGQPKKSEKQLQKKQKKQEEIDEVKKENSQLESAIEQMNNMNLGQ